MKKKLFRQKYLFYLMHILISNKFGNLLIWIKTILLIVLSLSKTAIGRIIIFIRFYTNFYFQTKNKFEILQILMKRNIIFKSTKNALTMYYQSFITKKI